MNENANLADPLTHIGVDADDLTAGMDAVSDKIDEDIARIEGLSARER